MSCPSISPDGLPLVSWIHAITGSCVYGPMSALSWVGQYVSVAVWVFSGTYQSWLCYKTKEVSGFSELFLLCWIVGAVLNTVGCFLTDQMFFQKLLGVYFLFSDSFLYFQYKYYIKRPHLAREVVLKEQEKKRRNSTAVFSKDGSIIERTISILSPAPSADIVSDNNTNQPGGSPVTATSMTPGMLLGVTVTFAPSVAKGAPIALANTAASAPSTSQDWTTVVNASLLTASTFARFMHTLGAVVGNTASWTSQMLYLLSRIPQIKQNYERKNTAGVSPALFIAVLVGTAVYTLAVTSAWQAITDPAENAAFVVAEMPFIVGGIATTLADLIIFFQLYIYRNNNGPEYSTIDIVDGVVPSESTLLISGGSKKVAMYA